MTEAHGEPRRRTCSTVYSIVLVQYGIYSALCSVPSKSLGPRKNVRISTGAVIIIVVKLYGRASYLTAGYARVLLDRRVFCRTRDRRPLDVFTFRHIPEQTHTRSVNADAKREREKTNTEKSPSKASPSPRSHRYRRTISFIELHASRPRRCRSLVLRRILYVSTLRRVCLKRIYTNGTSVPTS